MDTSGNTTESIHNVSVVSPRQFNINASAGNGGGLTPGGNLTEIAGANQRFTAIPNANYMVNQWLIDGRLVQTGGESYTLNNILTNHTVQATFTYIQPPSFNGIKVSGNELHMTLSGLSLGRILVLESSIDLKNWIPINTNTVNNATITLTNAINPKKFAQFFRAKLR